MNAAPITAVADLTGAPTYELALGMRHLGTNGLLESILFKEAVDFRLRAFEGRSGVKTAEVRADGGQRLYGAVYYLELQTPEDLPLSCWDENDVLRFVDYTRMSGRSMLDGYVLFDCPGRDAGALPTSIDLATVGQAPFGWIRVAQRFVHDEQGAMNLKLAEPANVDRKQVGTWEQPSSTSDAHRQTLKTPLELPEAPWRPLSAEPVATTIPIDPERDVNGAGLFYFPSYVAFIDMAERRLLTGGISPPAPDVVVGRRTATRRTVCYYGNASWTDAMVVEVRVWVRDRRDEQLTTASGQAVGLSLLTHARMHREHDQALVAVATGEKHVAFDGMTPAASAAVDQVLGASDTA